MIFISGTKYMFLRQGVERGYGGGMVGGGRVGWGRVGVGEKGLVWPEGA